MRIAIVAAGAVALVTGSSAMAQQAAPAGGDVNSYLCTFAGKCGDTTSDETPTRAAPATKGFRLAAATPTIAAPPTKGFRLATSTPTVAAPTTKGFRLATGAQAAAPTVAAPSTRSFRVARSAPVTGTPMASVAASPTTRTARSPGRRYATPVARPVATPGAQVAAARADLMLTFEYNSDQMTPSAQARARTFAQALMMEELRSRRFMIEGHTDARGSRDANIDLSRRRAQTVADFLIAQGVDRTRVEVKGVGPDAPLPGRSAAAEANRRVEAVLLS